MINLCVINFPIKDDVESFQNKMKPLKGSFMEFYKNGVSQGRAFRDQLMTGSYFPAGSIFKNGLVRFNFGPDFDFPPEDGRLRPVSERAEAFMVESTIGELLYATELDVKGERV